MFGYGLVFSEFPSRERISMGHLSTECPGRNLSEIWKRNDKENRLKVTRNRFLPFLTETMYTINMIF